MHVFNKKKRNFNSKAFFKKRIKITLMEKSKRCYRKCLAYSESSLLELLEFFMLEISCRISG